MTSIDTTQDVIYVRDLIARVEELREERDEYNEKMDDENAWNAIEDGEPEELEGLLAVLADLQGMGGDEQWEGDWYPITLIRDSYFEDYAQELADDIGAINTEIGWPNNCIDWERAARELQMDYRSVDIGDETYWTR